MWYIKYKKKKIRMYFLEEIKRIKGRVRMVSQTIDILVFWQRKTTIFLSKIIINKKNTTFLLIYLQLSLSIFWIVDLRTEFYYYIIMLYDSYKSLLNKIIHS